MRKGSITKEDQDFVETWENIAARSNVINRLDARGEERQEVISGRRTFMITTEERLITENKILDPKNDPFKNGDFRPVVVPETVNIETNPNALSDDEIVHMFKVSDAAWTPLLESLDSVSTLGRMLDLAEKQEDLTMKRFRDIERRLIQARGYDRRQITTNDPQLQKFLGDNGPSGSGGDVPTDGAANPRRGMGGRSSDYR